MALKITGSAAPTVTGEDAGMIYYDSTANLLKVYNGTEWFPLNPAYVHATGPGGAAGVVSGDYKYHIFTAASAGTDGFVVSNAGNSAGSNTLEYLIVGGGGSGRTATTNTGWGRGGGGAGGYRTATDMACPAADAAGYSILVGAAGSTSSVTNGGPSSFNSIVALGGGKGGGDAGSGGIGTAGTDGGSGGGGADGSTGINAGSGTSGQGNDGGNGDATQGSGGGGGGAGAAGTAGTNAGTWGNGGLGGVGSITTIITTTQAAAHSPAVGHVSGSNLYFSGGGGGAGKTVVAGGLGGGGTSGEYSTTDATAGTAYTGGGGGGGSWDGNGSDGANGGSGVVIIRYKYKN